jgi:hypothetical protein
MKAEPELKAARPTKLLNVLFRRDKDFLKAAIPGDLFGKRCKGWGKG